MTTTLPSVNSSSSTGAITSAGVGSGLDIETLISKLVSADRTPEQTRITSRQTDVSAQLSAIGTVKSLLANVQTKLDALTGSGGSMAALAANSSDSSTFTASAANGAVSGSYSIEVQSLAQADKQISAAISGDSSTMLGAGTLSIAIGGKTMTVTLGSTDNTLGNLRDAINKASDNPGVTATLITESGGTHLVLSSNQTGLANAMTVSSTLTSFTQSQPPQDAHLRVEGYDVYSASNTVSNAIDGVTLNLLAAKPGTTSTVSISADTSKVSSAMQSFVGAYNTAMATLRSLTSYNASTSTAGALNGDSLVNGAIRQLRSIAGSTVSGAGSFSNLSQIGISSDETGQLTLDSGKLSDALSSDSASLQKLFSSDQGYGSRMDTLINSVAGDTGTIQSRQDSLQAQLKLLSSDQDKLDARMTADEARYRKQYTALDTLIAQMNNTSTYLTQQLSAISKLGSSSSSSN